MIFVTRINPGGSDNRNRTHWHKIALDDGECGSDNDDEMDLILWMMMMMMMMMRWT